MPFGLKNAAQTFQRLMDSLLRHFPFVFVYLDDLLIFSKNREEHLAHLKQVLEILAENGLRINAAKCTFAAESVDYLGHTVTTSGLSPIASHVQPILDFPPHHVVRVLQKFLGMLSFFRIFLQSINHTLTSGKGAIKWTPEMHAAFLSAKQALASATPLFHPDPSAKLSLTSDSHVGAVLQQCHATGWQPLAFFSKKLSPTETRYSTFVRELLAVYLSVRDFCFLLEGLPLTVFSDHKPLVADIAKKATPVSRDSSVNCHFCLNSPQTLSIVLAAKMSSQMHCLVLLPLSLKLSLSGPCQHACPPHPLWGDG